MSSSIKFKCDFCGHVMIDGAAIPNGNYGMCMEKGIDLRIWSNQLTKIMSGPHICADCIESLINFFGRDQLMAIKNK